MTHSAAIDAYIPPQFRDGRPVRNIILASDVDGVIRNSTDGPADPQVIASIKELMADRNVDVAFISGTPVSQNLDLEIWRRGNITLDKAVGSFLKREMHEKKVTLYGALGGQRMTHEGKVEILEQYPATISFELGKLLLYAFLEEVSRDGSRQQKTDAEELKREIEGLKLINTSQASTATADEFKEAILKIRAQLDPNFRLISYGSFVESQTSNPPWTACFSAEWLKGQIDSRSLPVSLLPEEQKQVATGVAHREGICFNFLVVSNINKSIAIKKHIKEKLLTHPDALIVTIGDTQIDFPMHQHAHLAYHVGKENVWKTHSLPHCTMVRDAAGLDSQHVTGTLRVLDNLKQGIGKPLAEWKSLYS